MKRITLKSLTMRNFRGEKERTTNFSDTETSIYGENGIGKSRHFDAFVWLLFGKDTKDRKDFNIKTVIDGKPIERANVEVSAVLDIDGEKTSLRRVYAEKRVKPRGQVEEKFVGHEHLLFWNDVPKKVGEYDALISQIIDDSVFKMISNPLFFASMKWQDQREQLFQLAGTISDIEIASKKPEYKELLDKISGKTLAGFKLELSARKRKLKDELEQIQPRIDQTQKLMPAVSDWLSLEAEIKNIDNLIVDIDKAISDKSSAIRLQYEAVQAKQREINDLKHKQQQVLFNAKTKAQESAYAANAERRELERQIKSLQLDIDSINRLLQTNDSEIKSNQLSISVKEMEVESKRKEWYEENSIEYSGDDICHSCGQTLPEEKRNNARQLFSASKAEKLASINERGGYIKAQIENLNKSISDLQAVNAKHNELLLEKQNELSALNFKISQLPNEESKEIIASELTEWVELESKIKSLESTLDGNFQPIDTTELQARKKELSSKNDALKSELQNRDLIAKYQIEIEELEKKGKNLSQQIADAEREEFVIQNFTKERIDECERRVNGLFTMVTFKLFEYTIDGNESETCVPLVKGVPFGVANTAGQINAGLDIINALVKFHGVSAPIFIDGRESVNHIIKTESQVINLVVSHDKELIIK